MYISEEQYELMEEWFKYDFEEGSNKLLGIVENFMKDSNSDIFLKTYNYIFEKVGNAYRPLKRKENNKDYPSLRGFIRDGLTDNAECCDLIWEAWDNERSYNVMERFISWYCEEYDMPDEFVDYDEQSSNISTVEDVLEFVDEQTVYEELASYLSNSEIGDYAYKISVDLDLDEEEECETFEDLLRYIPGGEILERVARYMSSDEELEFAERCTQVFDLG